MGDGVHGYREADPLSPGGGAGSGSSGGVGSGGSGGSGVGKDLSYWSSPPISFSTVGGSQGGNISSVTSSGGIYINPFSVSPFQAQGSLVGSPHKIHQTLQTK